LSKVEFLPHRKHCNSKTSRLILFGEIIDVYSEKQKKQTVTKNAELINVKQVEKLMVKLQRLCVRIVSFQRNIS
jgi:hypothetical protein